MKKSGIQGAAVVVPVPAGGTRRAGSEIAAQAGRGACPQGQTGGLSPPASLQNPPKSHW